MSTYGFGYGFISVVPSLFPRDLACRVKVSALRVVWTASLCKHTKRCHPEGDTTCFARWSWNYVAQCTDVRTVVNHTHVSPNFEVVIKHGRFLFIFWRLMYFLEVLLDISGV